MLRASAYAAVTTSTGSGRRPRLPHSCLTTAARAARRSTTKFPFVVGCQPGTLGAVPSQLFGTYRAGPASVKEAEKVSLERNKQINRKINQQINRAVDRTLRPSKGTVAGRSVVDRADAGRARPLLPVPVASAINAGRLDPSPSATRRHHDAGPAPPSSGRSRFSVLSRLFSGALPASAWPQLGGSEGQRNRGNRSRKTAKIQGVPRLPPRSGREGRRFKRCYCGQYLAKSKPRYSRSRSENSTRALR
jgi:hypothetical protein